jgi:DUF1680 family protein
MKTSLLTVALLTTILHSGFPQPIPVPEVIPCTVRDRQQMQAPNATHLDGFLGVRIDANAFNRLLKIDETRLLKGFRHRPGPQTWDGEHVGKWMHAATLAWVYTQDPKLREKLDRVVNELAKCQLEDGYLGTYLPAQRWTEWDVWAHKYDMLGLLTYYRFTGNTNALEISRRCADLLCRTFGTAPGQKDIITAGYHDGLAPTSVLEPMVLLYRFTGEKKYLDFCHYILEAWEAPNGPKVISTLMTTKRVDKVGDAKAYEMLSCLNGLLELYRLTGEPRMLQAALNAWQDIASKRLYITGTASHHEVFPDDYDLPNGDADVGETCVTVTWLQFNAQLLRLTGEARFAEELERTVYNQLLGAQKPDGTAWGYYVQLEGKKPYSADLSGHCCLSSGPRGVVLIPTFAFTTDADGVVINFLNPGRSHLLIPGGEEVALEVDSQYPADGQVRIKLHSPPSRKFAIKVRIPEWAADATFAVNGKSAAEQAQASQYAKLIRRWHDGDEITLNLPMKPRLIVGDHSNRGKVAIAYGPLILAADDALNPTALIGDFKIAAKDPGQLGFQVTGPTDARQETRSPGVYSVRALRVGDPKDSKQSDPVDLRLVPFADAGCTLARYQVWLPAN